MSKTIDEKVVEMRFDNRHFETHTRETMSTLDKLKQKLNLTGASKGLENLNTSANKVNMSGMASALDTVHSKFSALEIIGTTALVNIANSAVNAGKRIVSALTIAPVTDGWKEYEMVLNSVQTTMAGTGKTAEEVEKELAKLDEYADKTVYSTSDMLNNLPKFTNAGVELEDATTAMIGIANATALAGGDANKASIAFYNLGQAIGTGYLTRMDYNSINNAGIATMEWKNQMVEAAIAAGTLKKVGEDSYQAGNKTLSLQQLFIDGLQEQWATTDVMMKVFKDYGDATTEIGKKSYSAAQDIKTYSQMMESLKATAGTGWKETWQIIFGGLDEAKEFWTGLSNFISKIITGIADFRNNLLSKALGSPFEKFKEAFDSIVNPIKETVETVNTALEDMEKMVNQVIRGDWGNGEERFNRLTEAGHNYYAIQNKVNETLGCAFRFSDELVNSQKTLNKSQEETNDLEKKSIKSKEELLSQLVKMSEAELRAAGYTEDQIEALKELKKYASMTGLSIEDLIANIDDFSGRWLLINSFKNIGQGLVSVFKAIGDAWAETVGFLQPETLFKLIAAFHKFTTYLTVSERGAQNLKDVFKGLFSTLDLTLTLIGGPIKLGLKILGQLFKALDISAGGILEIAGGVGRAITAFNNWLNSLIDFSAVFEFLAPYIKSAARAVRDWFKGLKDTEAVKKLSENLNKLKESLKSITGTDIINFFKSLGEAIKNFFGKINERFNGVPGDIFAGLVNGLKNGATKVIDGIITLANNIVTAFEKVLGIHSPSKVFFAIGGFIIAGLVGGLLSGGTKLGDTLSGIAESIGGFFGDINWSKIFSTGMGVGLLLLAKKITDIISNISAPFAGLGDMLSGVGQVLDKSAGAIKQVIKSTSKVLKGFASVLKGYAFKERMEGIKELAIALLILVGAIAILTMLDVDKMWEAVKVIGVLAVILAVLALALSKMEDAAGASLSITKKGLKASGSLRTSLITIGLSLLAMAAVVKMMGSMGPDEIKQGFKGLAGAVIALGALLVVYGTVIKGKAAQNMDKAGKMIRKMATTLLLMAAVVKIVSKFGPDELKNGLIFAGAFLAFTAILATIGMIPSKNISKLGSMLLKISGAMLLMALVVKAVSGFGGDELKNGLIFAGAFLAFVAVLTTITMIPGGKVEKLGGILLSISLSMLIMVGVISLLGMMDIGTLGKGLGCVVLLGLVIAGLMWMVKSFERQAPKLAATLIAMSIAIGILAATAIVLGLIDPDGLKQGLIAVGFLAAFMALLIHATKGATEIKGTLMAMAVAIGIMAAAVAILSFIDWTRLLPATLAMATLMGMFALIVRSSKNVSGAWKSIGLMVLAIGALTGAIWLIAQLPAEQALAASASLSILLLTLTGSLLLISLVGQAAMSGVGALALLSLVVVGLAAVIGVLQKFDLAPTMETVKALSTMLLAMSAALVILGVVGLLGPAAFIGIAALATLILALVGVVIAIGALMEWIPSLQSFLSTGLATLIQLAGGIGEMIGAFVKGVLTQIASGLPEIGANLSLFMINLTPFIEGAKTIDGSVLKGIAVLSGAIIALTAAELINGIASFLMGGSSFADLGMELSKFMVNAMPFVILSKQIDPAIMNGVKALAEAILIITATDILDGLTSWITGGNSLGEFGAQLSGLGTNLNQFVTSLGTFNESQVTTIQCACEAIKSLAAAAKELPNEGGLWGSLVGENSIATFGEKLPDLGNHLNQFVTNLGTFTDSQVATVDCAGQAIKALATAASEIPNTGGLAALFAGDNDISVFGEKLPGLGNHLNQFVTNLGTFSDQQVSTVDCAGKAIAALANAASNIPNTGGLAALFTGDNDISAFGDKLPGVGWSLHEFIANVGSFGDQQVSTVEAATRALYAISTLGNIDLKNTGGNLEEFGARMISFANKLNEFMSSMSGIDGGSVDTVISNIDKFMQVASTISSANSESIEAFADALKDVANKGLKSFIEEFSGDLALNKAENAVEDMIEAGIEGAEDKKSDVKKAFKKVGEAAVDGLDSKSIKNDMEDVGKDFVKGFANGIKNNTYLATDAASEVGRKALSAAKKAIDSNSPSKEAMKIGNDFDNGLMIGIRDFAGKVYNTAYNVGDRAKTGLSKAISRIAEMVDSDMDTQPTIRPVLDLSDVESGVGVLSGMFNNGPSLGVMANIGAISSGMNSRNQNGTDDVISAINKLSRNLGNTGGDTYNINGVTYDDGSNITDAVKTIVRAAKVGRRT